jgi:hypothetical protein
MLWEKNIPLVLAFDKWNLLILIDYIIMLWEKNIPLVPAFDKWNLLILIDYHNVVREKYTISSSL